jgi:hypothetical protein
MNSKTFSGIDAAIFEQVKAKLAENGLDLVGHQGSVSKMGVSFSYVYDQAAQTLTLSDLEVGFPASLAGYTPEKILTTLTDELAKRGIGS